VQRPLHYVLGLDGRTPRAVPMMEWAAAAEAGIINDREGRGPRPGDGWARVADDTLGAVRVSTVFLGLDHRWGDGPPLLFETMVFGGPLNGNQERYSTWDAAAEGHTLWLMRVSETEVRH
jgi:hypothetical protein